MIAWAVECHTTSENLDFRKGHEMNHVQQNSGRGSCPVHTSRRAGGGGGGRRGGGAARVVQGQARAAPGSVGKVVKNGRIKQSICGGCLAASQAGPGADGQAAGRDGTAGPGPHRAGGVARAQEVWSRRDDGAGGGVHQEGPQRQVHARPSSWRTSRRISRRPPSTSGPT